MKHWVVRRLAAPLLSAVVGVVGGTANRPVQAQGPALNALVAPAADPDAAATALDADAFASVQQALLHTLTDVDSTVVLLRGRPVFSFYRDGAPDALRATHSVSKSAISALVGTAIAQGHLRSVDERVLDLVPEWAALQSDTRAQTMTLRHLLTFTTGYALQDPSGTAPGLPAAAAWARPLGSAPGQVFAYDNSVVAMLTAVLEKATGQPLPDYARAQLVAPLQMAEPRYDRGRLALRTQDMARLGQLYLQRGQWQGQALLPADFAEASVRPQNAGGDPVRLAYGYLWWVVPGRAERPTFMASGWGGQAIWVHPPLELVVAVTSTASADSARRGHALQLIRQQVFAAAQRRAARLPR